MTRIVLAEPFEVLRPFVEELSERFALSGELLYRGRNELKSFEYNGIRFVVKKFGNNRIKQLLSLFRKGKAEKSYRNGCELVRLGVLTPTPIGFVQVRSRLGMVREAYYLSAYIPYPSLVEAIGSEEAFDRAVIDAFARFVAQLHEVGVLHGDLNTGNVRCEQTDEGWRFWLIDINRMCFAKAGKPLPRQACFDNMTRFSHNSPMFHHFLRLYLQVRGWEAYCDEAIRRKAHHDRFVEWKQSLKHR
ncbi:MAG: LPS kinase Kdo/WaaP [Alistipes sp.]|nr:LPS kinase Kdo/WaaP [Alistipes sp.]